MRDRWRRYLQEFARDRHSGSWELALQAGEIMREYFTAAGSEEAMKGGPELARKIIEGQPSMAAVINLVNRIGAALEIREGFWDNTVIVQIISQIISDLRQARETTVGYAAEKLSQMKRICVYSRSSIVEAALLKAHSQGADFSVVLSEARPGGEGITLAKKLASAGIEVELCVEAALSGMMGN